MEDSESDTITSLECALKLLVIFLQLYVAINSSRHL